MARNHSSPESEQTMAPRMANRGNDQPHDHPIDVDHCNKVDREKQSVFVREEV